MSTGFGSRCSSIKLRVGNFLGTGRFTAEKEVTPNGGGLVTESHQNAFLGGGFKYFLFSPLLGEDSYFD